MSLYDIRIADVQSVPVTRDSFKSDVGGLRFSDMSGGGHASCTFSFPSPTRSATIPSFLDFSYDLQIGREGKIVWRGRIEDFKRRRGEGGWPFFEVITEGYGVALREEFDTTRNVSGTETSTIVLNAITNLVPVISNYAITSTGFTLSGATAIPLSRMNAAAQIAWAARFGDSSDSSQMWHMYDDGEGSLVFTFKPRPVTPDWYLEEVDANDVSWGLSGFAAVNKVRANYNAGASYAMDEDSLLQGAGPEGWGRIIELMTVIPEITQSVDADKVISVLLSNYKLLRMRAEAATFDATAVFRDSVGRKRNIWEIRANDLVQLVDVSSAAAPGTDLSFSNSFLVVEKEYNEDDNTVSLTPESFDTMLEQSLAKVYNVLGGLHQAT